MQASEDYFANVYLRSKIQQRVRLRHVVVITKDVR